MGIVSPLGDRQTIEDCARQLRLIANDLRTAGDVPLVLLDRDGVADAPITLADELWLVAFHLDPDNGFENSQGPDA